MALTTAVTFLDALYAALAVADLGTGVVVYDGEPVTSDPADFLAVGYSMGDESMQVDGSSRWQTLGRTVGGDYEIPCVISVNRGETSHTAARTQAAAILDAAWDVLLPTGNRANVTALGVDGVLWARFDNVSVSTVKGPQGTSVVIAFVVTVREYVTSV